MDVKYRGEGSAAVVFAIPKSNEVLRLIKSHTVQKLRKACGEDGESEVSLQSIHMAVKMQMENVMDYMRNVMQPLFSNQFVVVPTLTEVPPGFAHKALALAKHERPEHRKKSSKDSLDKDVRWAFVLPDCCFVHHKNTNGDHIISDGSVDLREFMDRMLVSESGDLSQNAEPTEHRKSKDSLCSQEMAASNCCKDTTSLINGRSSTSQSEVSHSDSSQDDLFHPSIQDSSAENRRNNCDSAYSTVIDPEPTTVAHNRLNAGQTFFFSPNGENVSSQRFLEQIPTHTASLHSSRQDFTLSFEIKPKKAFMSPPKPGHGGTVQVCKFCMHQCLKFKDGKFSEISGYCPLDLFSGDRARMKHALHGLIKAPQHQLKICKNGKEVYGSEIRQDLTNVLRDWFPRQEFSSQDLLSDFLDLVIEGLLYSPRDSGTEPAQKSILVNHAGTERLESQERSYADPAHDQANRINTELTRLTSQAGQGQGRAWTCGNSPFITSTGRDQKPSLPKGCVLECMSHLQQMDQLDIEDVFLTHSRLVAKMEDNPELRRKCYWDGPYTSVSWILGENYGLDANVGPDPDSLWEDVLKVKRFLVSKTLQDCSIIVAIKPVPNRQDSQRNASYLRFGGALFDFSIGIIDLDPKSFNKVPFYYHQAVDITSAFEDLTS